MPLKVATKLGVTDKELDKLCGAILTALKKGPLEPDAIRQSVGDAARNMGPEGVKKGITTTVPLGLGILQSTGAIRDRPLSDPRMAQTWAAAHKLGLAIQMHMTPMWAPAVDKLVVAKAIADGAPMVEVGDPVFAESLAVALDKSVEDNAGFLAAVDTIIGEMRADGTMKALSEKWYGGLDLTVASE